MAPEPQHRRALPMQEWPAQDRALWDAAQAECPFTVERLPLSKWCLRQRHEAAHNYGIWLQYLAQTMPALLAEPPDARITPARLGQFLMERQTQIQIGTLAKSVADLYGIMISLAPSGDWNWLRQMRHLVSTQARRQPAKAKALTCATSLLAVGKNLIEAACAGTSSPQDPVAFRDGLILLMLILVPVRITQFSMIRLDEHLLQSADGEWQLRWQASETKTRREITYPLPPELAEILYLYIEQVRPRLLARARVPAITARLWIGVSGAAISAQVLRKIIGSRTKEALGYPVNPHAFRSSAASSYAIAAPEYAREAAALLDHNSFQTTERYYLLGQRQKNLIAAQNAVNRARRIKF